MHVCLFPFWASNITPILQKYVWPAWSINMFQVQEDSCNKRRWYSYSVQQVTTFNIRMTAGNHSLASVHFFDIPVPTFKVFSTRKEQQSPFLGGLHPSLSSPPNTYRIVRHWVIHSSGRTGEWSAYVAQIIVTWLERATMVLSSCQDDEKDFTNKVEVR